MENNQQKLRMRQCRECGRIFKTASRYTQLCYECMLKHSSRGWVSNYQEQVIIEYNIEPKGLDLEEEDINGTIR